MKGGNAQFKRYEFLKRKDRRGTGVGEIINPGIYPYKYKKKQKNQLLFRIIKKQ